MRAAGRLLWLVLSVIGCILMTRDVVVVVNAFSLCPTHREIQHIKSSFLTTTTTTTTTLWSAVNDNDDNNTEETFYSPNVALDDSRYRYDLLESTTTPTTTKMNDDDNNMDSSSSSSSVNEYSFFDEATIFVRAGSGGQGSSTYKKAKGGQDGVPDGGSGGRGGDVILVVDDSLNTLAGLTHAWRPNSFGGSGASYKSESTSIVRPKSFRAETGGDGDRQFKNGRYGKESTIRVPPGTVVQEEIETKNEEGEVVSVSYIDIGSLTLDKPQLVVALGGEGGEGSGVSGKFAGRGVRRPRLPPVGGERKKLKLTLKIVADVALVGVPNAGKSTFLASVTRAKPKIANYPFTTVIPNLGVWIPPTSSYGGGGSSDSKEGAGSNGLVLCDVPGLVAGAAEGVGLGHAFLRHVERCHCILHLVDATSNDPVADFEMLNREIVRYGTGQLAKMPQVVVVNKIDAFDEGSGEDWEAGLKTRYTKDELGTKLKESMPHSRLMWMSAKERDGVDDLMSRMAMFVNKVKAETKVV